jgi:hypothetical protein
MADKKWRPEDADKAAEKLVREAMKASPRDVTKPAARLKQRLKAQASDEETAERYVRDERASKKR